MVMIDGNNAKELNNKSSTLVNLDNYNKKLKCYGDEAIGIEGDYALAWVNKGFAHEDLG